MKNKVFLIFLLFSLILTSASASEIVQLTDDSSSNYFPQWSPNGEKLMYMSFNDSNQLGVWIMNSNGSNKQQISSSDAAVSGFWTPDGTKIIYFSLSNSSPEHWYTSDVWLYDTRTCKKTKVVDTEKTTIVQWVYNGSKLFIVEDGGDTQKLWLVDPDGTNKSLLTILSGGNTRFLWQPEGNSILYVSKDSGNYDIWIMDSDGSGKKQLTSTPEDEYAMGIAFSPDGSKIVYASRNTIDRTNLSSFEGFFTTVWTMDAGGANKTKLMLPNESIYFYPSWSPDGQKIAFERRSDVGRYDVVVIKADGSDPAILTADIRGGAFPKWSPKGDKITFVSLKDEKTDISVIILDEKWRSAPSAAIASLPVIPQGNGKKSPGFTISLVAMVFLIALELQKKTR